MLNFYKNKKVLITGHTGFKGSWMCRMLMSAGANITGYALEPSEPSLFKICHIGENINSIIGDIRDLEHLKEVCNQVQPEIVIHLAAQPIVRKSYQNPVYTYETNVMGAVNIMECVRLTPSVKSVINVTTDKVYLNREWEWGYRENEELNGYDPYSNSKSCSELVTSSYINSFFHDRNISVSTCRAGNVIGGGDFSVNRIIPDCIRSIQSGEDIIIRNPHSIRPYQHVLEPVYTYLLIAQEQYNNRAVAGNYNVGPDENDCWSTGKLATMFCQKWQEETGNTIRWIDGYDGGPYESDILKLDCSKIKHVFNWMPKWDVETALEKIAEWSYLYIQNKDTVKCMDAQIKEFILSDKNRHKN